MHTTALTSLPEFSQYQTVVVLMSNLDALGKRLIDLMNWVQNGGSVLFAMAPDKTTYFDAISQKLGVQSSAWKYKMVESIVPSEDFMLGGGQRYEMCIRDSRWTRRRGHRGRSPPAPDKCAWSHAPFFSMWMVSALALSR